MVVQKDWILKSPKVYSGCEVFVPFEDKVPFLDMVWLFQVITTGQNTSNYNLGTATITTIFLSEKYK